MEEKRFTPPGTASVLALVLGFGLATGLLELCGVAIWRAVGGAEAWLGKALLHHHFLWMTPASSLLVFGLCGVVPMLLSRFRPRAAWRLASGLVVFLAVVSLALMIRGLYLPAAGVLAIGVARSLAGYVEANCRTLAVRAFPILLGVWAVLLGVSFGGDALSQWREGRRLPPPAPGAPNILLIVLDTVRADAVTPYGSQRDTTPTLSHLAAMGTRFACARSTASWTLPSHASMFTGRLPGELRAGPMEPLDSRYPTIAEHLRARGYATGGFVANFVFGMRDYGLGRGFTHYEDRPLSLEDVFGCSALGRRIAAPALDATRWAWSRAIGGRTWYNPADPYFVTRRMSAADIGEGFVRWAERAHQQRRPFFAFLNLLDAHAPYLPAGKRTAHFGRTVQCWADYEVLRNWDEARSRENLNQHRTGGVTPEERALARDCYDDCIAALDKQLGRLMNQLKARALLKDTLVIITSDHGENFGEHGLYSHGISLHRPELDVPLLLIWPGHVPAGRVVTEPVSLQDLPATLADLSGEAQGAPFPGQSLARHWHGSAKTDLLFSELPELGTRAVQEGSKVLIRYGDGAEQFYDHAVDPAEIRNLIDDQGARQDVTRLRAAVDRLDSVRR